MSFFTYFAAAECREVFCCRYRKPESNTSEDNVMDTHIIRVFLQKHGTTVIQQLVHFVEPESRTSSTFLNVPPSV